MKHRQQDLTQSVSAAKAGISERSGRRIENNPTGTVASRQWRTRKDPYEAIWLSLLEPMLIEEPTLTGLTLWEHLDDNYPNQYPYSSLRTLQRRVKHFRHTKGPSNEVMFRQAMPIGLQGLSDFTHPDSLITIKGEVFEHLIYHFRLAYSGWRFAKIVQGGESYAALSEGLQDALMALGGAPQEHRTDSLSAAYNNHQDKQEFTQLYKDLCGHYGMKPTRNNLGVAHENGAIETVHGALKHRIRQAIKLRGSHDFETIKDYQAFIDKSVERLNLRTHSKIVAEKAALPALPIDRYVDYRSQSVKITSTSTMTIKHVVYSVPANLIGAIVTVRIHHDRLVGYVAQTQVFEYARVYPKNHQERIRVIDWRHVIAALMKKPQAFRHSIHREDLLPDDNYKAIWQIIDAKLDAFDACKWMVFALAMAAKHPNWRQLGQDLLAEVQTQIPTLTQLQSRQVPTDSNPKHPSSQQHKLTRYDQFIPNAAQASTCYH